ncbi:MAG: Fe-S cluster assembly protein SufD [Chloroflexi bacterium]|nr:Fe-S cluster assembly protein SufD [Chloroflexota bacterium]
MTTKKVNRSRVVKRKQSRAAKPSGEFSFTRDMIPNFSNGSAEPEFLTQYRIRAWDAFQKINLPDTTQEPWRRTDIRKLETDLFSLAGEGSSETPEVPKELLLPLEGDKDAGQGILTPQGVKVYLDSEISDQGVIFTSLVTAAQKHPEILAKVLGKLVPVGDDKFAAMVGALAATGILVYVPKGVKLEKPLHSVLWGPGVGRAHISHILVWVEDQASLTFVHETASPTENGQTLHAGIVEMHVGQGANLQFIEWQSWGENVWNFTHKRARVERDANLDWVVAATGSHLTKNFSEIDLVGEGATGRMAGLYFTDGVQHLDHDTQQNHLAPNTTSDLIFKGALEDRSRSVWQGMIYVAPDAQKTDGYQSNPNLVLSKKARADSIPGLEILADDVRCTHGATVGKIDPNEVFYMQSRGIHLEDAERIIVEGFFDPIVQRIPYVSLRDRIQKAIVDKLD